MHLLLPIIYYLYQHFLNDTSSAKIASNVVENNFPDTSKFLWKLTSPFTYKSSDISTNPFNELSPSTNKFDISTKPYIIVFVI